MEIATRYNVGQSVYRVISDHYADQTCEICHGERTITLRPENGGITVDCFNCYGSGTTCEEVADYIKYDQILIEGINMFVNHAGLLSINYLFRTENLDNIQTIGELDIFADEASALNYIALLKQNEFNHTH